MSQQQHLLPQIKQLLEQATSQDPAAIKSAEANLAACAEKWQIVPSLAQVYADLTLTPQIRLAATLQLKHALDRHWKTRGGELGEADKAHVKELFATTLLIEQNAPVAMQAAVIAAKIIRKDGNGSWPGLFNQLQAALASSDEKSKHHAAMALKELIKMMKSKRLPTDRKAFYQVAESIWPLAMELWVTTQKSLESSVDQHQFHCRLGTTRFALKIIKCLATHGNQSPGDCPKVKVLVEHLMTQMPLLLGQFNTLKGSINQADGDAFEKLVTLHAKVIALLAEDYHTALNGIQQRLLQFAAEVVTQGKAKYAAIPSRFLVKLMIIIKQFSAIARDPYVKEEEAATPIQLEAKALAAEFYNEQNLTVLVRFLIMDYLQLGQTELEAWESAPEEYISEEQQEVWKYDIRPCSEVLLLSLVHHYQSALVPVLVNMVAEVQNSILPACLNEGELSSNVLIADAVLNAIGLTSYELSDQVDFDSWFQSTLMPLMANDSTSKILKRRVSWLISQWVCVKFAPERRPILYELVLKMMSGGQDLVVRLESALLLKTAIDDYTFEPNQFVDLQQTACTSLFNLLTECDECDTKMRVLYIYSLILKRQRGLMSISIAQLSDYLPTLWTHAEQHHLLRGAIVCLLLELTLSVTSQSTNLYNLLIPILSTSCNPHSEFYIYLADDGLDLWLAVLQTAPALTQELLGLIEFIPSILQTGAENLKICFKILDCYLLLDIYQFTASPWFAPVCTMLSESFGEFNEDSQLLIVKFIGAYTLAAHAKEVAQLPQPMLQLLSHAVGLINVSIGPVLRSCVYSLIAHSMCYYKDSVAVQILDNVNRHEFINKWCLAMDSITHHDRRKISALLFIELLRGGILDAGQMMNPIICTIVEVLSDIGIRKVNGQIEDNLILTADERTKITSKSHPAEPAELWIDLRKQRVQLTNSAYTSNLVQLICEMLSEESMGQAYRATVDSAVRSQLENLLTGTTEGWGTSDTGKDKLFTQTGGERLTTDSYVIMVLKDVVGLLCCALVYVCVLYADFALVVHLLIPFANGTLATILTIVFNCALVMVLLSHAKATLSDPGYVPLPEARIDFSDRDALQGREDDWTICQRCEMWRPPRAHHCRVCKRCVRKMDHHCPWVNNCVGEWNQKFFILFLFYTFFCSALACVVVACYWKTTVDNIDHTPHVVTLLIEASLFGLFTAMVLYDQVYAIIDDETAVEARKRETGKLKGPARKRQVTNLTKMREVFGPGSYWGWLLPRANRKGSTSSPMLTPLLSYSV